MHVYTFEYTQANDPDDKKSSSEPGKSEQLNKFSVDLDVPPRNVSQ